MPDFPQFLEHLRCGMDEESAAALVDVLPDELDAWLVTVPDARRQIAKASAEFRREMTSVLRDCAQVNRSVTAARHFLQRPARDKQLKIDWGGGDDGTPPKVTVTMDMPANGRENP